MTETKMVAFISLYINYLVNCLSGFLNVLMDHIITKIALFDVTILPTFAVPFFHIEIAVNKLSHYIIRIFNFTFNFLTLTSSSCSAGWLNGYVPAYGGNGNSRNVSCSKPSLHCRKRPWEGALYKWLSASDAMHMALYKWSTFTFHD